MEETTETIEKPVLVSQSDIAELKEFVLKEIAKVTDDQSLRLRILTKDTAESLRLIDQRIAHLNTITYPAYWESEFKELKDLQYAAENHIKEEVAYWRAFRENHFFELVSFEEVVNWVKISGVQLKELAPIVGIDTSGLSRLLSGEKMKDDYVAYHKIKAFCVDRYNKASKKPK